MSNTTENSRSSQDEVCEMLQQIQLVDGNNDSKPCDVVLIAGEDNSRISCHREMLAAKSDYFAAMFLGDMLEAAAPEVTLVGVQGVILRALVEHCYTGGNVIKGDIAVQLSHTASMLQFDAVLADCMDYRRRQLTPATCLGVLADAAKHNLSALLKHATEYALKHFILVARSDEYLRLDFEHLAPLLASDELVAKSEQAIFESVMLWVQHAASARLQHMPALMALVRMPYISRAYLTEHVVPVCERGGCEQLVAAALEPPSEPQFPLAAPAVKPRNWQHTKFMTVSLLESIIVVELYCPQTDVWTPCAEVEARNDFFTAALLNNQLVIAGNTLQRNLGNDTDDDIELPDVDSDSDGERSEAENEYAGEEVELAVEVAEDVAEEVAVEAAVDVDVAEEEDEEEEVAVEAAAPVAVDVAAIEAIGGLVINEPEREPSPDPDIIEVLDLFTKQTMRLTRMQKFRSYFDIAILGGMLYAVGGEDFYERDFDTVERYNPADQSWSTLASISVPRTCVGLAVLNDCLYAVAGTKCLNFPAFDGHVGLFHLTTTECYDPTTDKWTARAPLNNRRFNCTVTTFMGCLYAFGVVEWEGSNSFERYDPQTNIWTTLYSFKWPVPSICSPLNGTLYAMHTLPNRDPVNNQITVQQYDNVEDKWSFEMRDLPPGQKCLRYIFPVSDIF